MSASELEMLVPPAPSAAPGREPGPATRGETRQRLLATIRALHAQHGGLSRIHRTHSALYAQARRAFGSWRDAVLAAGLDYERERDQSLHRGLKLRDQRRANLR